MKKALCNGEFLFYLLIICDIVQYYIWLTFVNFVRKNLSGLTESLKNFAAKIV